MRMGERWPATATLALTATALAGLAAAVGTGRASGVDRPWSRRWAGRTRSTERLVALAEPRALTAETAVLALWPGLSTRERASIAAAPGLAGLAGHLLKLALPRGRPGLARLGANGRASFPSTHTAGIAALACASADVARRHGAGWWATAVAGAIALAVGTERIHTRAHWPTDVIAGGLLGVTAASAGRLLVGLPRRS
jgi:membrane-associated phospholipid phosphatase